MVLSGSGPGNDVLLVTGGSRGIGAATARLAAERGYDVCLSYRSDGDSAAAVVNEIKDRGRRGLAVAADVANEEDVVALFRSCDDILGPSTVFVNNAGILKPQSRLVDMSADRVAEVMTVNVVGAFVGAREAVKRMSRSSGGSGGSIINVSSAASYLGSPNEYVDYAASKGALDTMTIGLAVEVADEGIRVNAVRPGQIYTDIHASGGDPGRVDRVASAIPMKRGGQPEEVAAAILWLASDEAGYVTGSLLNVSGGR